MDTVRRTKELCKFSTKWILRHLDVKPSTYYNWLRSSNKDKITINRHPDKILSEERRAVISYALRNPNIRHRELTWRMVDENVAFLSATSVYKILKEEGLICSWQPKEKRKKRTRELPSSPDYGWQSDISYIEVDGRKYYIITFVDEHSRYVTHHEVMTSMDGNSVSLAAERAISKLDREKTPIIQTDNGSAYISHEFKMVLSQNGVGHHRIHPYCPEENGLVERVNKTVKEKIDDYELRNIAHARAIIDEIIRYYNEERLHSAINFLRPIDYYRGDPEKLLKERCIKIFQARHRRREKNLKIKQHSLALVELEINQNHNLFQRTKIPLLS
ncbi:MAG: IS3 family transposase [bacterium]